MLTPHAKDPERKNELVRKAAQPETFGRTAIPKLGQDKVVLGAESDETLAAIKAARNDLVAKKELLEQAEGNLSDAVASKKAKPKEIDELGEKANAAEDAVAEASKILFDLIG